MKINPATLKQESNLSATEFLTTRADDVALIMQQCANLIMPVGAPIPWFGINNPDPKRFIFLIGLVLPISDYPELDEIYGFVFGRDLTNKTFNTPNLQGRYLCGLDATGTGSSLGGTFGAKGMAHFHGMGTGADLNITASGSHSHSTGVANQNFATINPAAGANAAAGAVAFGIGGNIANTATATHTHGSSNIDGRIGLVTNGQDGNSALFPPSIACNFITRFTTK
jgi:hypothetical protein